MSSAFFKRIIF